MKLRIMHQKIMHKISDISGRIEHKKDFPEHKNLNANRAKIAGRIISTQQLDKSSACYAA